MPGQDVADEWGISRQALGAAASRGELFSLKVGGRLYYPREFGSLDRDFIADVCRALGELSHFGEVHLLDAQARRAW